MNPITILFILALLIAIWWLVRKRHEAAAEESQAARRPTRTADTQFHAVSIKYSGKACKAAEDMTGRRFLATAAPKLPLPECDILECNCRFVHHKDRRAGRDRRSPFGPGGIGGGTGAFDAEQRAGGDRRKNDD